jgi:centrosomal protein CEP104
MSRKLKFKIISCSSEEQEYPISSLLFAGSEGWQSRRFCTFPQEITLEFYGVANIKKIELVSHHAKIASQVDILYYVPTGRQEQRFYKYGYLQFNRNEGGNVREQKTIMVDISCLYLRFLFHKPHPSK